MIDLGEPVRKEYSEDEKKVLRQNFFLTLHTFLLAYLALHNFLIPVVANIFKGHVLWEHVHFWFLVHIPVNIYLRKGNLPFPVYLFLFAGSLTRFILEIYLAPKLTSWMMLSVFLSESSSLLFFLFYYPEVDKGQKKLFLASLLGAIVAGGLVIGEISIRPEYNLIPTVKENEIKNYGCQGSTNKVVFPLSQHELTTFVDIQQCGFVRDEVFVKDHLKIKNNTGVRLNMRIYRAKWLAGRLSWRFQRLVQVPEASTIDVEDFASFDMPILLKVPERKNLGHILIVPNGISDNFPKGELELTYDTLKWVAHE